jgi:hypothetical protein
MKQAFQVVLVGLFIILVFGSIMVENAAAKEQGPFDVFKLTADDPGDAAEFGRSIAIDGDLVAVGAGNATVLNATGQEINGGAVYLFKRQGMVYVPEAELVAPDPTEDAEFGRSVAIKGETVFVGARFAQVGDVEKAGAVYIYRKYKGSWHFEDKIVSPDSESEDNFGRALAFQSDLLVVTARKEASEEGAAYLFSYNGGSWMYQEKITAGDSKPGDYFGQSVALQGDLMAIGARNANPDKAGAVYLFRQSGYIWEEIVKVSPTDGKKGDHFGFSVAISGDTIAVGARKADLPDAKDDAGAAYIFSMDGDSVEFVTKLTAGDASAGDEFGQSIAIAGDAIAVGAWRDDIGDQEDQGSIYLFRRMGGQWIETGKVTASDGATDDEFGYSLSAFGNRIVTGAHFADSTGVAYLAPLKV